MFGIWGNKPYRATDMALETEKGMYIYSLYYQFSNGSIFNNSRRLLIL